MNPIIASIQGRVISGKQVGRTIGFPTANLFVISEIPVLNYGVYGVSVHWDGTKYLGVMNIGERPTFNDSSKISYEVHILDFNKNIYNEIINVDVIFYVRNEQCFNDVSQLVKQIKGDITYVENRFRFINESNQKINILGGEMKNDTYTLIHLPDLLFAQWCDEKFGINRGVYNTIDSWLYQKGILEITKRRVYTLNFLQSLNPHSDKKAKCKFGHGGLSNSLDNFWKASTKAI